MDASWIQQYQKIFQVCPLFRGLKTEQIPEALAFFHARQARLARHEILQFPGEPFRYAGIVLSGSIEGSFLNENDAKISVSRFGAGQLFGEALACLQPPHSPIQLEAIKDSIVLLLDITAFHQEREMLSGTGYHLAMNLIHNLAQKNLYQNRKIRILSQKKLRDRIGIFLREMPRQADGAVLVRLTTTAMAEFLGVNRSALSRELGQMQDDGELRIEGRRYYLAQP
jgi:CRP-like cAMP-binding protein